MAYATGRCMCHTALRLPFEVDDVVAMVRKVFAGRVTFHDGEDEIVPGVTVHHIGGHSKGLQSVHRPRPACRSRDCEAPRTSVPFLRRAGGAGNERNQNPQFPGLR